jgi:hypothetical protein
LITLPRQARDKHRESAHSQKKRDPFSSCCSPGDLIENYLPTKLRFVNRVPLLHSGSGGGGSGRRRQQNIAPLQSDRATAAAVTAAVQQQRQQEQQEEDDLQFAAVGVFWCRGMRGDVLQGVDRRSLHTFTAEAEGDPRYTSRTDPGHTFEVYGFPQGVSVARWEEGVLLGRWVAAGAGNVFFAMRFHSENPSICQDRLGTNMGEVEKGDVSTEGETTIEIRVPSRTEREQLPHPTTAAAAARAAAARGPKAEL